MRTRAGDRGDARARYQLGIAYFELAGIADSGSGRAVMQAAVGNYVLAAIAFADAICLATLGRRSADADHSKAAELLALADREIASDLKRLLSYKTQAHYGSVTMTADDLSRAHRHVARLAQRAVQAIG